MLIQTHRITYYQGRYYSLRLTKVRYGLAGYTARSCFVYSSSGSAGCYHTAGDHVACISSMRWDES